ncbi:MAG TPA: metal-dependent hydrolase [Solirubrobacterales bacterium]|jgi:L-ascorbate metabolism protein UlaG (beta-lactamase superfamily)
MEIKFHGHSCFELGDGDVRVLIDPFLKPNNPVAVTTGEEVNPTHIALSHGHADHVADAAPVAKRTGAKCVAIVELAKWLEGQGVEEVSDPNFGGTVEFEWGYISLVPAWHTNTVPGSEESPFSAEHGIAIGPAAGLVIKLGETTVYHAGDTCLFSDMKLIARRSDIDVALLPIGGHYTMDRRDAVIAAEFVGADTVIPMHFNTFPAIETDAEAFKSEVDGKTSSTVVVLAPGESHSTG